MRLEPGGDSSDLGPLPDGAPNVIGGSPVNFVLPGVAGATIGGGGYQAPEILAGAQLRMDCIVATLLAADRIGAAGIIGAGAQ